MSETKIGILGGMGPAATVELFQNIITGTRVKNDQDHIEIIILNDPKVPDRTMFILDQGENPIPIMKQNIERLQDAGASVIMIPCMTAHTFIEELQNGLSIPIINGIELINSYLQRYYPNKKIGLLATTGSVKSKVYQKYIKNEIIVPNEFAQKKLMHLIYGKDGIKTGNTGELIVKDIQEIVEEMESKSIEVIISGCTELGLVINSNNISIPVIDPLQLLAKKAIELNDKQYKYN